MREAPVGHQCLVCIRSENRHVRQAHSVFGGRIGSPTLATYALIALNITIYLVELARPVIISQFSNLGSTLIAKNGQQYVSDSGTYPSYELIGVAHGEWYRLITSAFLHALPGQGYFGITHLIFNMVWLWLLGRILERELGWARFIAVYLLATIGSSVLEFLIEPHIPAMGASGAIYGLAASYLIVTRRLHNYPIDRYGLIITFLFWMVVTAGFTSWEGHLGGFLTGGLAAMAVTLKRNRVLQPAATIVLTGLLVGLAVVKALHMNGAL